MKKKKEEEELAKKKYKKNVEEKRVVSVQYVKEEPATGHKYIYIYLKSRTQFCKQYNIRILVCLPCCCIHNWSVGRARERKTEELQVSLSNSYCIILYYYDVLFILYLCILYAVHILFIEYLAHLLTPTRFSILIFLFK